MRMGKVAGMYLNARIVSEVPGRREHLVVEKPGMAWDGSSGGRNFAL